MKATMVLVVLVGLLVVACGDDGSSPDGGGLAAGAPCTPTSVGAAECASKVCLKGVQCFNGAVLDACAGEDCTKTGSCTTAGEQCVPVTASTMAFCLPTSTCNNLPAVDGGD